MSLIHQSGRPSYSSPERRQGGGCATAAAWMRAHVPTSGFAGRPSEPKLTHTSLGFVVGGHQGYGALRVALIDECSS
jgi:hypothetical protein